MKLIGQNSISKYFSYFFLILFGFIAFHFIYEIIGFSVLYYKYKTGSNILSDYFLLGNDVGWSKNEYTNPIKDVLKFKIYYPFTTQNLLTGIYSKNFMISNLIGTGFFTIYIFKFRNSYIFYYCFLQKRLRTSIRKRFNNLELCQSSLT